MIIHGSYKNNTSKDFCMSEELLDERRVEDLVATTWLSEREAQLYVLVKEEEMLIKDSAEVLGLESETAYDYWSNVKDKVRKSRETVELKL